MRVVEGARFRSAYLVLTLSVLLAGDAWRFTIGWWAVGALVVLLSVASVLLLVAQRQRWRVGELPYPLLAFLALATASLAWSAYPGATALGLATTWLTVIASVAIAVSFTWRELLAGLGHVLRAVLALSLLFELFVSLVIRAPVLPLFGQPGVDYASYDTIPKMLYWSRNELFQVFGAGRIQGIVGNANNLGMLALIALIVFALQFADRHARRSTTLVWLAVAAAVLVFTRSATVTVALVGVVAVAAAALLVRRAHASRARALTYGGIVAVAGIGVVAVGSLSGRILEALGKSSDLTGRLGIWDAVSSLARERPVAGWGWVSYWVPWAAPFDNLAFRNGVRQLQAHNAWIDVWFQLGILGLIVFGVLVASSLVRAWLFAVDRPQVERTHPERYVATSLLPLLVLSALLVQSVAESRLLVEFGLMFLVIVAVRTKRGAS
jgi:O-antigen ligase